MGLNDTSSAQRVHIGFFGRRNSGKSSLVNAVTGQALSVVSDVLGTTTDPVQKSMELLPIGPVLIIDTPGMDDEGELGQLRVEKTRQILRKTDVAVVVMSAVKEPSEQEKELLALLQERKVPTILAVNKIDLAFEQDFEKWKHFAPGTAKIFVSAREKKNIEELKNMIGKLAQTAGAEKPIVSDLVQAGDIVILVTPIDAAAPKGRLILPQQQVLRDLLDHGMIAVVTRETELAETLSHCKAGAGGHRQSGIWLCKGNCTAGNATYVFFRAVCQIQRTAGNGKSRSRLYRPSAGWGSCADLRGLQSSQAMRRYRNAEAARVAEKTYGKRAGIYVDERNGIRTGSDEICTGDPLRWLHAE